MGHSSGFVTTLVFVVGFGSSMCHVPSPCSPPMANIISQLLTLYRLALSQKSPPFPPMSPCAAAALANAMPDNQYGPPPPFLPPHFIPQFPPPQFIPQFSPHAIPPPQFPPPQEFHPQYAIQNSPGATVQPRIIYVPPEAVQGYPFGEPASPAPVSQGPVNYQYVQPAEAPRPLTPCQRAAQAARDAQRAQYSQTQATQQPQAQNRQVLQSPQPQSAPSQAPYQQSQVVQYPQPTQSPSQATYLQSQAAQPAPGQTAYLQSQAAQPAPGQTTYLQSPQVLQSPQPAQAYPGSPVVQQQFAPQIRCPCQNSAAPTH